MKIQTHRKEWRFMAEQKEQKSIRYRFLKDLSTILLVSTIVLSTVIALNEGQMLNRSLLTKGKSFASYIAKLSTDPLIMKDGIQLDSIVSDANKDEDILYAVIYDANGDLYTSQYASINYRSPRLKPILSSIPKESELQDIISAIREKEAVTEVSVPILAGAFRIGKVTVCLSQDAIRRQILSSVLSILALNVVVAFILGFMVFSLSRQVLFKPLAELARETDRLAKGDHTARITLKAAVELQELFDNFNRMAGDLDTTTVSKDYMDNIIQGMINALVVTDHNDTIMQANEAACTLLGYKETELIGSAIDRIFDGSAPIRGPHLNTLQREKRISMIESTYRAKSGRKIPVLLSISVLHDKDNVHHGAVYIAQDFTERKLAEEALRESEQKFRAITTTASDAILLMDDKGKILYWNPAAERIFGYPAQEAIGKDLHLLLAPQRLHGSYETGFAGFIASGQGPVVNKTIELTAINKEGREFPIEISTSAMNIKDRWHALGIIRDITERKKAEMEMQRSQTLESIGTLAGGIAHDFNNLLQGVFGYISLAKLNAGLRGKCIAALGQAEKALHLTVGLTSQLLTFSKGGKPIRTKLNLASVIENSAKFALSGSRSEYKLTIAPDLLPVNADSGQIGQVIQNIVLNADQSMPKGGQVDITAKNVQAPDPELPKDLRAGMYVQITIRDHGVGIPEQNIGKIFDPYFTTREKGSGLGLATSYSIIKNHDGLIHVESEVGKGTLFAIYLQAAAAETKADRGQPMPTTAAKKSGRILVMDDEQMIQDVAGELLKALGHEAEFTSRGEETIEKYEMAKRSGKPFDVIILDLTIRGGMGGAETIKKLLQMDPNVKAIVSSGYSDDDIVSEYVKQGFKAFINKPYTIDDLRDLLNKVLNA